MKKVAYLEGANNSHFHVPWGKAQDDSSCTTLKLTFSTSSGSGGGHNLLNLRFLEFVVISTFCSEYQIQYTCTATGNEKTGG